MGDPAEVVHAVWGVSRAESVRDALRWQGCRERVIALPGALNVGPIGPADPHARTAWLAANLRGEPDADWREPEAPWAAATAPGVHPVYWVCRTDAAEHACFLAFASRMAGRPFDVVDATDLDFETVGGITPVWSLGLMRPEDIVASGLGARRRPFSGAEREAAVAAWSRLRWENAPLRVVRDGRLVSAPLTHFDAVLTEQADPDREPLARLIGRVLHHLAFEADPPGQGVGDEFLFARILALGEAGALDVSGPGPGLRDYQVRRPARHPPA